jgi:gluconolactonase
VPEPVANICFSGPKLNRPFIAASSSLYNVYLNTRAVGLK